MKHTERHGRSLFAQMVLIAALTTTPGISGATEYGRYDIKSLLVANAPPATGGRLNLEYLDAMLQDLGRHAGNYPPSFDSNEDLRRAQRDAASLIGMFDAAFKPETTPDDLLLRLGLLGSIAHNLDISDAARFAQVRFAKLLAKSPTHAMGNYHYGQFLAGSGRPKEAVPYLNAAKDKGVTAALYTLGMTYLSLGEKDKALELLGAYKQARPGDTSVERLVEGIRSGKVQVRTAGGADK